MVGMVMEIIVVLFEEACAFMLYQYFVDSDKKRTRIQTGGVILLLTVLFLVSMLIWSDAKDFIWKELFNIALMSFLMKWYNGQSLVKNIVLAIIYIIIGICVDFVGLMFFSSIISKFFQAFPLPFDTDPNYTMINQAILLFSINLTLYAIIRLIGRIVDKRAIKYLDTSQWMRFVYFPIFTICVIGAPMQNLTYVVGGGVKVDFWIYIG